MDSDLLEKNLAAWEGRLLDPSSLDTSLKKNTAFVKKITKSMTKDLQDSIIKEINQLSLKKYQGELLLGVEEGVLKTKTADVMAATNIISVLHQRFCPEFTQGLMTWFLEQFANPVENDEDDKHVSKVKVLLRVFTMLIGVGCFRGTVDGVADVPSWVIQRCKANREDDKLLILVLKETLSFRMRTGISLTVATTFVKRFTQLVEEDETLNSTLKSFTEAIIKRATALFEKLKATTARKYKAQIRTGRVLEELEEEYNELSETFERFKTAAEQLGPVFKLEVPNFEDDTKPEEDNDTIIVSKDSAWQNDEEKKFYMNFPEIPQELVEKTKEDTASDSSRAQEMTDFLLQLETAVTPKDVDEATLKFWELNLFNKASKNRLLKHFITSKEVGKVKVYARFLKSNEAHLKDIIEELIQYLDQGFRSQIHHGGLNFKNIAFFSEMIKFQLIEEFVVFHKIRSLILNLTIPNNIEILSIFFEISGRYLLTEHNALMEEMLALLEQKRKTEKLTINNKMAISNLFLVLKPPSIKTLQQQRKSYTPTQLFLKHIIRNELTPKTVKRIRKIIISVGYTEPTTLETMHKLLSKPDKVSYENIIPLSELLRATKHGFKIMVVDTILENILRGMELNDYRYNRIRMAQCKYLAEIHEREIISLQVIHDVCFKMLTYGHQNNSPTPMKLCEIDMPDDYFRVQMVCLILNTVTMKDSSKFDVLLRFLDYYIWIKEQPLPKAVDFSVVSCFTKFKVKRSVNPREAMELLAEVVKEKGLNAVVDDDDDDDESSDDDDDEDEDEDEDDEDDPVDDGLNTDLAIRSPSEDPDENENKISFEDYERKMKEEEEKRIEEQLERDFKKLVFESMHTSKNDKSTTELPTNITDGGSQGVNVANGKVAFRLVTRKGKNMQTKSLELPKEMRMASNVVHEERRQRLEKEKLNKFILNARYDEE